MKFAKNAMVAALLTLTGMARAQGLAYDGALVDIGYDRFEGGGFYTDSAVFSADILFSVSENWGMQLGVQYAAEVGSSFSGSAGDTWQSVAVHGIYRSNNNWRAGMMVLYSASTNHDDLSFALEGGFDLGNLDLEVSAAYLYPLDGSPTAFMTDFSASYRVSDFLALTAGGFNHAYSSGDYFRMVELGVDMRVTESMRAYASYGRSIYYGGFGTSEYTSLNVGLRFAFGGGVEGLGFGI